MPLLAPTLFKVAAGLGLGALLLKGAGGDAAKPAKPKEPKPPKPSKKPEAQMVQLSAADLDRIQQALKGGTPSVLRALASELEKRGFKQVAADLRAEADRLERAKKATPKPAPKPAPKPTGGSKPKPKPATPKPATPAPVKAAPPLKPADAPLPKLDAKDPNDREALALTLANHLYKKSKGTENQKLVQQFQQQEGLVADGIYGPKTGYKIANYGIIPAKPYYWSKVTWVKDKEAWSRDMKARAQRDPARAKQWEQVANVFGAASVEQPAAPGPWQGTASQIPLARPESLDNPGSEDRDYS